MVTTIFFDVDDTLVMDSDAAQIGARTLYAQFAALSDIADADLFAGAWVTAAWHFFDMYSRGEISFAEQRRKRIRYLFPRQLDEGAIDGMFDVYYRSYKANWRVYPEVLEALESLRKDYRLGIISNSVRDKQLDKLICCGIKDYFPVVCACDDAGASKPSAKIFQVAAQRAGVALAECAYVGDRPELDFEGARNAGMVPVWLNRNGAPLPEGCSRENMITNLLELERTLALLTLSPMP
jgi:putative hydrolase of the HAD superfamily